MGGDLQRVSPGDRLNVGARAWNAFIDAAKRARSAAFDGGRDVRPEISDGSLVLVQNNSGRDVDRFGVLAIAGVAIEPSTNLSDFLDHPILVGATPRGTTRTWVHAQEPIPAGAIGVAKASGVTPAMIYVDDDANAAGWTFATKGSTTARLTAAERGAAEILWREPGVGEKWGVVRLSNTPSDDLTGVLVLGIVVAPSTNGAAVGSYTVDVYGSTVDSLFEAATDTGRLALQDPVEEAYYRGEVVGLTQTGSVLRIQKFLTTAQAFAVDTVQICLRLRPTTSVVTAGQPTNFMVDLAEVLEYFNGVAAGTTGYLAFSFGPYAGIGSVGLGTSIPVRYESGWTLVVPIGPPTNWISAINSVVSGDVTQVATSQNTVFSITNTPQLTPSIFWGYAAGQRVFAPGELIYMSGSSRLQTQFLTAQVTVNTDSTLWAGLLTSLPSIPTITGGINSSTVPLVTCHAVVSASASLTSSPPNALEPTAAARRAIPAGGGASIGGTYDLGGVSPALTPSLEVSAS